MSTKRNEPASFRELESQFNAQMSRFNALASHTTISDAMSALMLLANASVDSSQRVSIIAALSPSSDTVNSSESIDEMPKLVYYASVATVIRQCDKQGVYNTNNRIVSSHAASFNQTQNANNRRSDYANSPIRRNRTTREHMRSVKYKTTCNQCGRYGNWSGNHRPDGSLPDGVVSSVNQIIGSNNVPTRAGNGRTKNDKPNNNTISFKNVKISNIRNDDAFMKQCEEDKISPLVDSGAPYSEIVVVELSVLSCQLLPKWNGKLDEMPSSLTDCAFWQYVVGDHASPARRILGSIAIPCRSACGSTALV